MWILLIDVICIVLFGFSLGSLWGLQRIKRVMKKTKSISQEVDYLLKEQEKLVGKPEFNVCVEEIKVKLQYLHGRLDAVSEWFG